MDATSNKLVGTPEHFQQEGLEKSIGIASRLSTNPSGEEELNRKA